MRTEPTLRRIPGDGRYRRLEPGLPQPVVLRTELVGSHARRHPAGAPRSRTLFTAAQLTDLHVTDCASPGRIEWLQPYLIAARQTAWGTMFRPQEALAGHALAQHLATLGRCGRGPASGAPLDVVLLTGDLGDGGQANELERVLALLQHDGRDADLGRGVALHRDGYQGVQDPAWELRDLWLPDDPECAYVREHGFPTLPGLLTDAARPVASTGLATPWTACHGNHDTLLRGGAAPTATMARLLVGEAKPVGAPPVDDLGAGPGGFDLGVVVERFLHEPEWFAAGPTRRVTAAPARAALTRAAFVERTDAASRLRLRRAGAAAYGAVDVAQVRLLQLDTVNPGGHWDGSVGDEQLDWLDGQLAAADTERRPVLLVSHHGPDALDAPELAGPDDDMPRHHGSDVLAAVHRHRCVVAWISGHTHRHAIVAHPRPGGEGAAAGAGFWHVGTASLADWPSQARLLELVDNADSTWSLHVGVADHDAPAQPEQATGDLARLAAVHRELAANDPGFGQLAAADGAPGDRSAELLLAAPE